MRKGVPPDHRPVGAQLLAVWLILMAWPGLAATDLNIPPPSPDDVAIDESGLIWAAKRTERNALFTFDGAKWSTMPVDFGGDGGIFGEPAALGRFDDGAVACVWRLSDGAAAVSRHLGSESKVIYRGPGEIWTKRLPIPPFCDSRNRLWITGNQPNVWWVDGQGNSRVAYEIKDSELVNSKERGREYNPFMATEDARGRVWIWSNASARGTSYASLDGILVCDGDVVVRQQLKGLEGRMFGPIARLDSQHMIVSVLGVGLYRVNIDTWHVDRIGDPAEKAFSIVQNFFRAGPDLYVLVWGKSGGQIWRLRDRTWTRLVTGYAISSTVDRASLVDGDAFLLASAKNTWLFRGDKAPQQLSWATRFPVESVKRMLLRPDGKLFFLGDRHFFCGNYTTERTKSRVRELTLSKGFAKDGEGYVWCVSAAEPGVARRWMGNRWHRIPLPKNFPEEDSVEMVPDTKGRIWFLPGTKDGPVAYFDLHTKKGSHTKNLQSAYQQLVQDLPQFLDAWPTDSQWRPNRPSFHEGRIAFRSGSETLEYFDGENWRSWKQRDIVVNAVGMGQPYFDNAGELCVTIRDKGWKWDGTRWAKIPADPRYPDYSFRGLDYGPDPVLPDGFSSTGNVAKDNEGSLWYTRDGMLYRLKDGTEEAMFDPDELHPFAYGSSPHQVIVDRTGHTFFSTVPGRMGWFVVCPRKGESHAHDAGNNGAEASPKESTTP